MARGGYRIFGADTHIIEPVEPIEQHLAAADRAKLATLGPLIGRTPAKAGISRYQIGKRPALDRRLGSRERVAPPASATRGARDGGTPWDVRWQGPPFPTDRVSFDPHARVKDMDIEGIDVNMILPSGGVPAFCSLDDISLEQAIYQAYLKLGHRREQRPHVAPDHLAARDVLRDDEHHPGLSGHEHVGIVPEARQIDAHERRNSGFSAAPYHNPERFRARFRRGLGSAGALAEDRRLILGHG